MSFKSLGLRDELVKAVEDKGYSIPTPIQEAAIPLVLKGGDLMGAAQTGTGKTAGFTLPVLQRLAEKEQGPGRRPIRALVLTPTRELAAQVAESVADYGRYLSMKSTVVYGGVSINPQKQKLIRGVDILVATPGRLLDHVNQRSADLSKVEILILDEADRMLDMGFIHDIRKVLALVPKRKQTLLFSATFSSDIKQLANGLLNSPSLVEVTPENKTADTVRQSVCFVDKNRKRDLLSFLIGSNNWKQVLVFHRTKHGANRLAQQLNDDGIESAAIHGNKSQGARTRALKDFKDGNVRVLVATDIAARGLDISQLPHVVNFELPNIAEDYVHRIGRTGRAGLEGEAVSLVCIDEKASLADIQRLINGQIQVFEVEGFEVDPTIKAEPIKKQKPRSNPRNRNNSSSKPQNRNSPGGNTAAKNRRRP
jgi:ATP-dependent RNA helicase RhlE